MTTLFLRLRDTALASTAAVYAWCAAAALSVLIEPTTLIVVTPPALVASVPLLVPRRHQPLTSLLVAGVLAFWGIFGMTLLGGYFLPSAALLVMVYVQSRRVAHRSA